MNWIFWALLILALVLLILPFAGLVTAALEAAFWILGALLLVAAIIWAISAFSRSTASEAT